MVGAIRSVAGLSGHSFAALMSQAEQESGLDVKARNRKSTATGPFQFIERTWLDLVRRHGSSFGLGDTANKITVVNGAPTVRDPALRKQILALREDPNISAGMAARYLSEGKERLGKVLGRPASAIEGRIAYIMGPSGAARLISAAEKTPGAAARDILPSAAAANRNLFHDKRGHALSAADVVNRLTKRMAADEGRFAQLEDDAPDPFHAPAHSNALLFAQSNDDGSDDGRTKPGTTTICSQDPPGNRPKNRLPTGNAGSERPWALSVEWVLPPTPAAKLSGRPDPWVSRHLH